MRTSQGAVRVDFFGPFRVFGKSIEVPVTSRVDFDELVSLVEERVGPGFARMATKSNTTFIIDRKVIPPAARKRARLEPGDTAAFALLLGGG